MNVSSSLRFIAATLSPFRLRYAAILAFTAAEASCGMLAPWAFGRLLDALTFQSSATNSATDTREVLSYFAVFVALCVGDPLLSRGSGFLFVGLLGPQRHRGTMNLFARLQARPYSFFSSNTPGALGHRIAQTAIGVNEVIGCVIFDFWPTVIALSVAVALLVVASPWLGVGALLWLVVYFGWSYRAARRAIGPILAAVEAENTSNAHICDSLTNQLAVIGYGRHAHEIGLLEARLRTERVAIRAMTRALERIRWLQFSWAVLIIAGVTIGAYTLFRARVIELGAFSMATGLCLGTINHTHNLSQRLVDFFSYWGKIEDGTRHLPAPTPERHSQGAQISLVNQALRFDGVGMVYGTAHPVLSDLSFEIQPGERIAIVGPSGAGKSTILHLLLGLILPSNGRILFGSLDSRGITPEVLRQQIALLPQEPLIFRRTVDENIRYGNPTATTSEVQQAVDHACCADAIRKLPKGAASSLGEPEVGLSRGELQRIALARTLLKNAPVLLLDEATANLDPITENELHQAVLGSIRNDQTLILVTHRLAVCARVDRVLLIDHGRLIAAGPHQDLLARSPLYREMWANAATASREQ